MNGDGGWNLLDIVKLVNCVLAGGGAEEYLPCNEIEFGCAGDMNDDGNWNMLDIVTLTNCVLNDSCDE